MRIKGWMIAKWIGPTQAKHWVESGNEPIGVGGPTFLWATRGVENEGMAFPCARSHIFSSPMAKSFGGEMPAKVENGNGENKIGK
jgi:hypothetical protein